MPLLERCFSGSVAFCALSLLFTTQARAEDTGRTPAIVSSAFAAPANFDWQSFPEYPAAPKRFHHVPTIEESSPGKFVIAWYASEIEEGDSDQDVLLSTYDGSVRTTPRHVTNNNQPGYNPVLFRPMRDPSAPLYLYFRYAITGNGYVLASEDDGATWYAPPNGAPYAVDTVRSGSLDGATLPALPSGQFVREVRGNLLMNYQGPIKNRPLELPDGAVLMGSSYEEGTSQGVRWWSYIEKAPVTNVGGRGTGAWSLLGPIGGAETIQPSFLVLTGDYRELLITARNKGRTISTTRSTNGGESWGAWTEVGSNFSHGHRGHDSLTLDNGYHVLAAESSGRKTILVSIAPFGANPQQTSSWTPVVTLNDGLSTSAAMYPSIIQVADRKVHLVYAHSSSTSQPNRIRHVIFDPDVLVGKTEAGPTITTQPQDQHGDRGARPTFTVAATGRGTVLYQWQRNTGSGRWYSHGRSTSLQVGPLTDEMHGWRYRCVVTDDRGTTVSQIAVLTVGDGPPIPPDDCTTDPALCPDAGMPDGGTNGGMPDGGGAGIPDAGASDGGAGGDAAIADASDGTDAGGGGGSGAGGGDPSPGNGGGDGCRVGGTSSIPPFGAMLALLVVSIVARTSRRRPR